MSHKKKDSYIHTCQRLGMGDFEKGKALAQIVSHGVFSLRSSKISNAALDDLLLDGMRDLSEHRGVRGKKRCFALVKIASIALYAAQVGE